MDKHLQTARIVDKAIQFISEKTDIPFEELRKRYKFSEIFKKQRLEADLENITESDNKVKKF